MRISIKTNVFLALLILMLIPIQGCYYFMAEQPHLEKWETKREKYINEHPQIDENLKKSILKNEVQLGMTKEQVMVTRYSNPSKTGPTTKYEADEVWVYNFWNATEYLYFRNGSLIKIENINKKI